MPAPPLDRLAILGALDTLIDIDSPEKGQPTKPYKQRKKTPDHSDLPARYVDTTTEFSTRSTNSRKGKSSITRNQSPRFDRNDSVSSRMNTSSKRGDQTKRLAKHTPLDEVCSTAEGLGDTAPVLISPTVVGSSGLGASDVVTHSDGAKGARQQQQDPRRSWVTNKNLVQSPYIILRIPEIPSPDTHLQRRWILSVVTDGSFVDSDLTIQESNAFPSATFYPANIIEREQFYDSENHTTFITVTFCLAIGCHFIKIVLTPVNDTSKSPLIVVRRLQLEYSDQAIDNTSTILSQADKVGVEAPSALPKRYSRQKNHHQREGLHNDEDMTEGQQTVFVSLEHFRFYPLLDVLNMFFSTSPLFSASVARCTADHLRSFWAATAECSHMAFLEESTHDSTDSSVIFNRILSVISDLAGESHRSSPQPICSTVFNGNPGLLCLLPSGLGSASDANNWMLLVLYSSYYIDEERDGAAPNTKWKREGNVTDHLKKSFTTPTVIKSNVSAAATGNTHHDFVSPHFLTCADDLLVSVYNYVVSQPHLRGAKLLVLLDLVNAFPALTKSLSVWVSHADVEYYAPYNPDSYFVSALAAATDGQQHEDCSAHSHTDQGSHESTFHCTRACTWSGLYILGACVGALASTSAEDGSNSSTTEHVLQVELSKWTTSTFIACNFDMSHKVPRTAVAFSDIYEYVPFFDGVFASEFICDNYTHIMSTHPLFRGHPGNRRLGCQQKFHASPFHKEGCDETVTTLGQLFDFFSRATLSLLNSSFSNRWESVGCVLPSLPTLTRASDILRIVYEAGISTIISKWAYPFPRRVVFFAPPSALIQRADTGEEPFLYFTHTTQPLEELLQSR